MGWEVEFLKNLGEEHDQINDRRNDDDQTQFVEGLGLYLKCCGGMNNDQDNDDQCRPCRKAEAKNRGPIIGLFQNALAGSPSYRKAVTRWIPKAQNIER